MYLLITGASGHIGSSLASLLNKKKIKTILVTRSKKKKKILNSKFKNCKAILNNQIKKKIKISTVIHTASLNDRKTNKNNLAMSKNLTITKNILKKLDTKNLKKIIYLSTAQVYGSNLIKKVDENTALLPNNNYGISRYTNEIYLKNFAKKNKVNLIILRISNIVGEPVIPNKACERLLPNDLKRQSILGKVLALRSSGLQYRNFLSMHSTINIILNLIKKNTKGIQIFNLGGVDIQIIEFVKSFVKIYSKIKKKKLKLDILSDDPKQSQYLKFDYKKIMKFLKIRKKENIDTILKKFLEQE